MAEAPAPGRSAALATPVALRWADTDEYGHVNNVALARCVEEARIRLFGLPDRPEIAGASRPRPVLAVLGAGTYTVVVGQRLQYSREVAYRGQDLVAEGWISAVGSRSITLAFRLLGEPGVEHATAAVTVAVMDVGSRAPRPLTEVERAVLQRHVAPPPPFR